MASQAKEPKFTQAKVPASITLKDGSIVKVNDFVYLDSLTPGDFFQIVRIMRFLPASNKKDVRAEVAHMYRRCFVGYLWSPTDDPQLLYMTLSTEEVHVSHMVGRCFVNHSAYIHDMDRYKKLNDHFYFNQFYDRNLGDTFDALPTKQVLNFPEHILSKLPLLFSFVFCEKSESRRLKDERKECPECNEKADSSRWINCMLCEKSYHKPCANPPYTSKNSKYYQFQCSMCLNKADVDFNDPSQIIPVVPRGSKSISPIVEENNEAPTEIFTPIQLVCTQNHPIRYLGKEITPELAIDPDAPVHIRVPVKLEKIRVIIPDYVGPESSTFNHGSLEIGNKQKNSAISRKPNFPDPTYDPESLNLIVSEKEAQRLKEKDLLKLNVYNHNDNCILPTISRDDKVLFHACNKREEVLSSKIIESLRLMNFSIPTHSIQFQARAYQEIFKHQFDEAKVILALSDLKPIDFGYELYLATNEQFEKALLEFGTDFESIAAKFPPMSLHGAVQKYFSWKIEVKRAKYKKGSKFSNKPKALMAMVFSDDPKYMEDVSIVDDVASNGKRQKRNAPQVIKTCANCKVKDQTKWTPIPIFVTNKHVSLSIYCSPCADYFFRYAVPRPLVPPAIKTRSSAKSAGKEIKSTLKQREERARSRQASVFSTQARKPRATKNSSKSKNNASSKPLIEQATSSSIESLSSGIDAKPSSPVLTKKAPSSKASQVNSLSSRSSLNPLSACREHPADIKSSVPKPTNIWSLQEGKIGCFVCFGVKQPGEDLVHCQDCGLGVHVSCRFGKTGIVPTDTVAWECDFCTNKEEQLASRDPTCLICKDIVLKSPAYLVATEGGNWAHLYCLAFADQLSLNPENHIIGLGHSDIKSSIPCKLCTGNGTTAPCGGCEASVHAICALSHQYIPGFFVDRKRGKITKMIPKVWCSNHTRQGTEFVRSDELDFESGLRMIILYLRSFKARVDQAFVLSAPLAATFDSVSMSIWSSQIPEMQSRFPNCLECHTKESGFWWNAYPALDGEFKVSSDLGPCNLLPYSDDVGHPYRLCHLCYHKQVTDLSQPTPLKSTLSSSPILSSKRPITKVDSNSEFIPKKRHNSRLNHME